MKSVRKEEALCKEEVAHEGFPHHNQKAIERNVCHQSLGKEEIPDARIEEGDRTGAQRQREKPDFRGKIGSRYVGEIVRAP